MRADGFSFRKRIKSFYYAFSGIKQLVVSEHNAWIHCIAALLVVLAGWWLRISSMEWVAVTIVIGAVMAAEAINSSIEVLCDLVSPDYHPAIKRVKDLAAGAVLLMAIAAAVVGLIIFVPKLIALFV
ncbi:diacylglycerol kinase family protein [Parabacteroides sp. OttesenSCG-928-N08]|nr:diacylglycerol kinase family protein [Parabacteroides sp. OttesenSCG-928-N08]